MGRKNCATVIRKLRITFEVMEGHTNCCDCLFGSPCPFYGELSKILDCSKHDLGTLKLVEIKPMKNEGDARSG